MKHLNFMELKGRCSYNYVLTSKRNTDDRRTFMLTDLQAMDQSSSLLHEVFAARDNENITECGAYETTFTPKVGMEFQTEEDEYQFYNAYGRMVGFSIRKEYANKNRTTKEITSRKFVCCKEGIRGHDKREVNVENSKAETRTGCAAYMKISLDR